jgi:prepilin-type N-terminal cleavage/methylation domain-containing protein
MSARIRARRRAAGFTLIELMIVVVLISIVALLAIPKMAGARDDRLVFDSARRIAGLIHHARTRAIGRGAAHMVVLQAGTNSAGQVLLFEALDGIAGPTPPGPNPVSSCKRANWAADISAWTPGTYNQINAGFIEAVDLNTPGVATTIGLGATYKFNNAAAGPVTVYCVTPYGPTFAATGSNINNAVQNMVAAQPFTGALEVAVQRGVLLGTPVGLKRRVIVASDAAPRIQSQ